MEGIFYSEYSSKLQKKKNSLRQELVKKGMLKREGFNKFDKYSYFSEAQYKELFSDLFSKHGLELTVSAAGYREYEGTDKQSFGRIVEMTFTLTDIDTGYSETSTMFGEGMDKGDKGGYKAYTGALKYYLANTFMVVTGDDPESESPEPERRRLPAEDEGDVGDITRVARIKYIESNISEENKKKTFDFYNVKSFAGLTNDQIDTVVNRLKGGKK